MALKHRASEPQAGALRPEPATRSRTTGIIDDHKHQVEVPSWTRSQVGVTYVFPFCFHFHHDDDVLRTGRFMVRQGSSCSPCLGASVPGPPGDRLGLDSEYSSCQPEPPRSRVRFCRGAAQAASACGDRFFSHWEDHWQNFISSTDSTIEYAT